MNKIMIIGCPGSGKSTFARKLAVATKIPLYYLDQIWHKPDKTNISKEEFDSRLIEIMGTKQWIIDGNYNRTLEMRMKECDSVILFDLPTEICIEGALERVGKQREDMPWCEESLDEEFRQFILKFRDKQLPNIYTLLDKYRWQKKIVIFNSREDASNYLMEYNYKNEDIST